MAFSKVAFLVFDLKSVRKTKQILCLEHSNEEVRYGIIQGCHSEVSTGDFPFLLSPYPDLYFVNMYTFQNCNMENI